MQVRRRCDWLAGAWTQTSRSLHSAACLHRPWLAPRVSVSICLPGERRRKMLGQGQDSNFFDATNQSASTTRDKIALETLDELLAWLSRFGVGRFGPRFAASMCDHAVTSGCPRLNELPPTRGVQIPCVVPPFVAVRTWCLARRVRRVGVWFASCSCQRPRLCRHLRRNQYHTGTQAAGHEALHVRWELPSGVHRVHLHGPR